MMKRPLHAEMMIKVCGMKHPDNIRDVAALTPMMMGFIFYPGSPRYVGDLDPEVVRSLPDHIRPVGVFVNASTTDIVATCRRYGISIVQLHGDESPEQCRELRLDGLTVFKAIGVADASDVAKATPYDGEVDMLVFDTKTSSRGGSGVKFDHTLLDSYSLATPYLLSGGIGPDDVTAVVDAMRPGMAGIDINSRFESEPGVKNLRQLIQFILSLRSLNEYEPHHTPFWEKK